MRRNIWVYDTKSKQMSQITKFTKFDITYLSASAKELVFEVGGKLYLMDAATQQYKEVPVNATYGQRKPPYQSHDGLSWR